MLVRDALVNREIARIRVFTDWCQRWQVRGFIGEIGWNQNDHDIDLWNELARSVFEACLDPAGCHVTTFAASGSGTAGAYIYMYQGTGGSISSRRGGASITEWSATAPPPLMRGVNVVGGEFAAGGTSPTSTFSNLNPGTYGLNYTYQDAASASYLASRGLALARVSVRWERIQPTLGGALDPTELTRLTAFLDRARLVGLRCVLDVHNYGSYYKDVAGTGTRFTINDGTLTVAHFTDLWSRLSTQFKAHSGVWAYGLMNEPTAMTVGSSPIAATAQANWEYITQQAVATIRANTDSKLIMVAGYNWSHASTWTTYHPAPWIADANIAYEAHHYFDTNVSGTGVLYQDELATARSSGYTDPVRAGQMVNGLRSSVDAYAEIGIRAEGG